ncbi:MAG: hypothetical protein GTN49_10850 [candidate division Zixibacteria bacterium]|nr:hypothetical protein [candidate division Zixibacteria bacterium]
MGSIVTPPNSPLREYVQRAGGDRDLASYDIDTQTLTAPDVTDTDLANAKTAVDNRTANVRQRDRRRKRRAIRRAALQRHEDAVLAADAVYQTGLTDINAATTLADLDAIPE